MTVYMPIQPLLDLYPNTPRDVIAANTGIDSGNFTRMCQRGRIRWDAADKAAVNIGLHPANIWPTQWPLPTNHADIERAVRIDLAFKQLRQKLAIGADQ